MCSCGSSTSSGGSRSEGEAGEPPSGGTSAGTSTTGGAAGSSTGGSSGAEGGAPSGGSGAEGGSPSGGTGSGAEGGAPSGGSGAEGGSSAGSGAEGGSSGGSGRGGGGNVPDCEPNTGPTDSCGAPGDLCTAPAFCCRCVEFEESDCGFQWSCARPANSPTDCPSDAPTVGSGCDMPGVTCQYCLATGPAFIRCSRPGGSVPSTWTEGDGLTCQSGQ